MFLNLILSVSISIKNNKIRFILYAKCNHLFLNRYSSKFFYLTRDTFSLKIRENKKCDMKLQPTN